ncbi:phage BR0599 family protein [Castellaniella hirudinis]|uniref:phage BR0599 family protein n=1 Tax=Castellaniella hirudinis TaxID=1144617 RepID=UPI0039C3612F
MSYPKTEISNQSAQPAHLYEFVIGAREWRYTSADRAVTVAGKTYQALAITNNNIRITGEARQDALRVTMASATQPGSLFIGTPPGVEITMRIRRWHWGDDGAAVVYVGTISEVDFPTPGEVELTCATVSLMQAAGLRRTWARQCQNMLYDQRCRVNAADYRTRAVLTSVGGGLISSAAFASLPDGWFAGGYIEWTAAAGHVDRRGIDWHLGDTLGLLGFSDGLAAGLSVNAYAGCDRTMATCAAKFRNAENFGGFPHLAGKSPFDGNPVF